MIYIVSNIISICTFSTKDEKCIADVGIILGAATYEGEVSLVYQERLNHAITLYTEGFISKIIVTGGIGEGNSKSDAYAAMKYITENGVPEEDIFLEEKSTITQENLVNSKKLWMRIT